MNTYTTITHEIPPVYDRKSRILILGSLPSVASRQSRFFYGHPRNRFWELMALLLTEAVPTSIEQKRALLLRHRIALWDVIKRCDIIGSSDASIKNAEPNDLTDILAAAPIRAIFANGARSCQLYERYTEQQTGRAIIRLPSTSPANAAYSLTRLQDEWQVILPYLA